MLNLIAGTADSFFSTSSAGGDGPCVSVKLETVVSLVALLWLELGSEAVTSMGMAQKDLDLEPVLNVVKPVGHGRQAHVFPGKNL